MFTSKLILISQIAQYWTEILDTVSFSGTLYIDEKYVRIAELKNTKNKRPFAYLYFAIDPLTYDVLYLEVYYSHDYNSTLAFLTELKTQGIYPKVIMTDFLTSYDPAIRKVYGRSVTISKCHFHFKQNIHKHTFDQFGKKDVPELAKNLKKEILQYLAESFRVEKYLSCNFLSFLQG